MQPRPRARRHLLAVALIATFAALSPALRAAEVYVPLLNPVANDGSHSETQLWLSNVTAANAAFLPVTLAENSDGTQRPGAPGATAIGAGRTFQLTNLG